MIFLSYSWIDFKEAHSLKKYFDSLGFRTWIDQDNLDLSAPLESQISQAIQQASVLLFLDSNNSRSSSWTNLELSLAENAGVKVITCPVHTLSTILCNKIVPTVIGQFRGLSQFHFSKER